MPLQRPGMNPGNQSFEEIVRFALTRLGCFKRLHRRHRPANRNNRACRILKVEGVQAIKRGVFEPGGNRT
jgi:hypothetical protein